VTDHFSKRGAQVLVGLTLIGLLAGRGVPDSADRPTTGAEAPRAEFAGPTTSGTAAPDSGNLVAGDRPVGGEALASPTREPAAASAASPLPSAWPTASAETALSLTPPALTTTPLVHHPLRDLSPAAAKYLATRAGPIGVAVVVPSQGRVYMANGNKLFPMASLAKVAIMVTVLDRAIREGRDLTAWELALLEPMITVSDNDAATALWDDVGGAGAVGTYLRSLGLTAIRPNAQGYWGDSRASASEVALLLTRLVEGKILDEPSRRLAIELMTRVDPEQSWGMTARSPDQPPPGTVAGIKDGWYPAECGWRVNSAGFVIPGNEQPAYTIAILTRKQPSLEEGIETIEELARHIHAAIQERRPQLGPPNDLDQQASSAIRPHRPLREARGQCRKHFR
jgi:hypothetical protein